MKNHGRHLTTPDGYPWLDYAFHHPFTPALIDSFIQDISDKELKEIKRLHKRQNKTFLRQAVEDLYKEYKHLNGTSYDSTDIGTFAALMYVDRNNMGDLIKVEKLYYFYYFWSFNPVTKRVFKQALQKKLYRLPVDSLFIIGMMRRLAISRRRRMVKENKQLRIIRNIINGTRRKEKKVIRNC